jgi:hypothetical protein
MASFGVSIGWFGWGVEGGLFPNVRFGVLHIWVCRGSMLEHLKDYQRALSSALVELRRTAK